MAIVNNFWLKDQTKQLAGAVIYQAMGQTRARKLAESVSNPRTVSQMTQRVKWANLVNLYRANQSWMKYAFETKKTNQSEYNKFMSLNVSSSRIYLTKQQAANGACVVDEYLITQGSLPSIEVTNSDGDFTSNIYLPNNFNLSPTTTVGQFAQAVLAQNPAIREGDQISFIRMTQQTNSLTGVPYVTVREYEIIMNSSSAASFWDYMPEDLITTTQAGNVKALTVLVVTAAGGFAFVLSRTIGGRTYVSSQRIQPVNMSSIISQYSSAAQLQAAIASYGESEDAFLSSVTAGQAPAAAIPLSIVEILLAGNSYIPGQNYTISGNLGGHSMNIVFNQDIGEGGASVSVQFAQGELRATIPRLQGSITVNEVSIEELPESVNNYSGWQLSRVFVTIGQITYEAAFVVIEPLE